MKIYRTNITGSHYKYWFYESKTQTLKTIRRKISLRRAPSDVHTLNIYANCGYMMYRNIGNILHRMIDIKLTRVDLFKWPGVIPAEALYDLSQYGDKFCEIISSREAMLHRIIESM